MEIRSNFINFHNDDDNSRVKKDSETLPVLKKEKLKQTDEKTPVDPKYWQNRLKVPFRGNKEANSKEENYIENLETLCTRTLLNSSFTYNLSAKSAQKLCELIQEERLSPEEIATISNKLMLFTLEDKKHIDFLVDTIYDACTKGSSESENKANAKFINNLSSPFLISRSLPPDAFAEKIRENSYFERAATDFFVSCGSKKQECAFSKFEEFKNTISILDEENFESYKASYIERSKDSRLFDIAYVMNCFKNPKTQKYDPKIEKKTKELEEKRQNPKYKEFVFGYSEVKMAEIARAMVDKQIGKICDKAVQFTNDYFFGEKTETEENKLISFVKSLHTKRHTLAQPYYKDSYSMHENFAGLLDDIKDNTGAFNDKNIKYMSKLLEGNYGWGDFNDNLSFFKFLKDENGVVKRSKFNFAQKILEKTNDMGKTSEIIDTISIYGKENFDRIFKMIKKLYGNYETFALDNVSTIMRNCFNKDGTPIEENLKLIERITHISSGSLYYNDEIFEAFKKPDCKELLAKIEKRPSYSTSDITSIVNISTKYSDENGKIYPHVKEKIDEFLLTKIGFSSFEDLYEICIFKDENGKKQFDEELYKKSLDLIACSPCGNKVLGERLFLLLKNQDFKALLNQDLSVANLKFKTKVDLFEELSKVNFNQETNSNPIISYLKNLTYEIDTNLSGEVNSLPVEREDINKFIHAIFFIKPNSELSTFEATLKNAIPKLKEMNEGLPLKYSRQSFLSDLSKLIENKEQIKLIENKTDINLKCTLYGEIANIEGYEGILTLDKLDRNNDFENKVYNLCYKFMYENKINTGDKELDNELNTIIKAVPEFINCIGKKQHGTHKYTLDIHQLLVLANSIDNPDYKKLNGRDKAMLKITALLHDIAKQENIIDKGHQEPSALYTRGIIKKLMQNPETIERIYELTRNHHWLEEYSNSNASKEVAQQMAFKFRRPNDFEIAKIIAKADLMAVSDEFYENHKQALNEDKMLKIENELMQLYETGSAIFADKIIRPSLIENHKETYMGREYKVIDFHKIQDNESLADYGFRDVKKKDVKLLVHMLPEYDLNRCIETVKKLTSSINGGVLSESLITPIHKRTYCNRQFGVLLSQINPNVVNTAEKNQGSGTAKDIQNAINLVFSEYPEKRNNFKNSILKNLLIDPASISPSLYAEFYKKHIAHKTSISNFPDNKIYHLGNHSITGKQIKEAINKYQDDLINKEEKTHNEIVGYVPKIEGIIGKAKSLSEIPKELLDFAHKNNYPIILI